MNLVDQPLLLFLALFALYSPLAALPSYFPVVGRLSRPDQRRLAIGLFVNVLVFAMIALWVGEPLLEILGLSTVALGRYSSAQRRAWSSRTVEVRRSRISRAVPRG